MLGGPSAKCRFVFCILPIEGLAHSPKRIRADELSWACLELVHVATYLYYNVAMYMYVPRTSVLELVVGNSN